MRDAHGPVTTPLRTVAPGRVEPPDGALTSALDGHRSAWITPTGVGRHQPPGTIMRPRARGVRQLARRSTDGRVSEPGLLQSRARRGHRRLAAAIGLAVVAAGAIAGCGEPEDASLCTAYAEFLDRRAEVAAADPTSADAATASDVAERYLAAVNRLQHAADGRYVQQLEDLEEEVQDIVRTLAAIPDDADYATWAPLIDEDFETAQEAAGQVERLIAASCVVDVDTTADAAPSRTSAT